MSRLNWPRGAWSYTQIAKLQKCPRLHALQYRERIYPLGIKAEALEIGSGFHRVLELVGEQAALGHETPTELWDDAVTRAVAEIKNGFAKVEVVRLTNAYRNVWREENAGYSEYDVLAVENVLSGGKLLCGVGGFASIADVILRDDEGVIIGETKTAARLMASDDERYIELLKFGRPQLKALAYCGRERFGYAPRVMHNITTKAKTVMTKRLILSFSDDELDSWALDVAESVAALGGLTCKNLENCAPANGYACDYFKYCHGTDEERETLFKQGRREEKEETDDS